MREGKSRSGRGVKVVEVLLLMGWSLCVMTMAQGRYRALTGGTSMESCSKCPQGTFVNTTGSTSDAQCNRCPDGTFGPEAGMHCLCYLVIALQWLSSI